MPHTKSAKKRLRQSMKRRLHNRTVRADLRTQLKKVHHAIDEGNAQEAQQELKLAYKKLDKCGARRYLHPNKADRLKARLTKRVNAIPASES